MKQEFQFFQDFIDAVSADRLDSSAESISFPGGWSAIVNQQYEGKLRPIDVVGQILQFSLQHNIPILSRADKLTETTCKKPPILPLNVITPGKIFSLAYLSDEIRVFVSGFYNFMDNRGDFKKHVERQRNGAPHFGLMFLERGPAPGTFRDGDVIQAVKGIALAAGFEFAQGVDLEKKVDELLVRLWREFMSKRFPHYK